MKHALVVDDQAPNRELLNALLGAHGFRVTQARNGAEALTAALQSPPDVLITDLLMPELDGYALLQRWRAEPLLRERPAIVYTATYTEPQDEALALRMGADAFLIKPMEPEAFIERLKEVLDRVHGTGVRAPGTQEEESGTLRLYNDVLVRKLESKTFELEQQLGDLMQAKAQVERLGRRHAVLSGTNQAIVHIADRERLLETVCRVAVEYGGAAIAWVGLLDSASGRIVPAASWGDAASWLAQAGPFEARRAPRAPVEHAIARGELFVSNDLLEDPAVAALHPQLRTAGLRSGGACPLCVGSDVVGAVTLLAREPGFFDDLTVDLLREIGADLSFALANFERDALRRHTEHELARLNEDLEARIRARTADLQAANEELNTFSYSVSHDLRAPLAAIAGFTQRVLEDPALGEASSLLLQRVLAASHRMESLIDDLMALAGLVRREVARSRCDLSALAHEVVRTLREQQPGRAVQVSIAAGMTVHADPGLMRVVLDNLLGNAWKFTSKVALAQIEFGEQPGDTGERVFFVRDNGDGFDTAFANNLFTPFQRLHRSTEFEGSGIGLSIVQRAVRKHGGRIGFDAAPGQGARFWFTLGATPAPSRAQAAGR